MTSSPHNNNEESPSRLSLAGVTLRFGETLALEGITLDVEPGERLAIIGASGAGKSTLFRALTRTVALDGGKVYRVRERERLGTRLRGAIDSPAAM